MQQKDPRLSRFPQVYAVEASAGSGKTYTLARRYVQLLLDFPLSSILAITFTNKASLEMKDRILEFLKRIALDDFKSEQKKKELFLSLGVEAAQMRPKALACMESIISNYNFFQVQTIDSFINSILNGCAFKLGLSANFKTEKQSREYLQRSLDRMIERAAEDPAVKALFDDFLRQYLYLESRAGWFPRQALFEIIRSLYGTSNLFAGTFYSSGVEARDLLAHKQRLFSGIVRLNGMLPEGTHQALCTSLEKFIKVHGSAFSMDDISAFFAREQFPIKKGFSLLPEVAKQWDTVRAGIAEYCRQEAFATYNAYVAIFSPVLDDLRHLSGKDNVLFLESLNKQARSLFDEQSLELPELYFRLARRFKHFLIDEFQDTSILQWKNLFPMVEEALAEDGSFFFVGDRKQAIYRFRGGDATLIDSVRERFRHLDPIDERLAVNYRSQKEIVAFNNRVFSQENLLRFLREFAKAKEKTVALEEHDLAAAAYSFKECQQQWLAHNTGGYVHVEAVYSDDTQDRQDAIKDTVLGLVAELKARYVYQDIAFLVRTNEEVALLTSWFMEREVPVESEKTLDIRQHPYIKELVSFLRFLNSPIDNLSFASFIMGEIFCSCAGVAPERMHGFLLAAQQRNAGDTYLYREFRAEFPGLWQAHIEEFFKSVGYVPLYELVVSIISAYQCLRVFPAHQGFFMRLLELIKEQEEQYQSIAEFLEFFESAQDELMYVHVAESNAVKVLTIHKAKGLEFPVVVIPFLEFDVEIPSAVTTISDGKLMRVRYSSAYAKFCPEFHDLAVTQCIRGIMDELNTVYVAFTRASQELYIYIPSGGRRSTNSAGALFEETVVSFGAKSLAVKRPHEHVSLVEIPAAEYRDWIPLLRQELSGAQELLHRHEIASGEVLHALLRGLGNVPAGQERACIADAVGRAKREFPFVAQWQPFEECIARLLASKTCAAFFRVPDGRIVTEYEVVDRRGDTKRIDRLILLEHDAWVIDYKSSRPVDLAGYQAQVNGYAALVEELFPGKKVKRYLVFLDTAAVEEVRG